MTTTNQDESRLAELSAVFVTLDDRAKDSAITILRALDFAQSVVCPSGKDAAN